MYKARSSLGAVTLKFLFVATKVVRLCQTLSWEWGAGGFSCKNITLNSSSFINQTSHPSRLVVVEEARSKAEPRAAAIRRRRRRRRGLCRRRAARRARRGGRLGDLCQVLDVLVRLLQLRVRLLDVLLDASTRLTSVRHNRTARTWNDKLTKIFGPLLNIFKSRETGQKWKRKYIGFQRWQPSFPYV